MSAARLLPSALIAAVLLAGAALPASPRAFQVMVLAAMLAALWGTGSRLARRLAPDFGPASHGVAAFSLAVGIAVVPATWLGQLGWLRPGPFLAWTAATFLLSHLLPRPADEVTGTSPAPAAVSRGIRIDTALLIMAALAVALVGLYDLWRLLWSPPGAHGFDDVSYHLSEVATWIRHGDVRMLRFSMGDPSTPFYPILGEMAAWVLIAPFRDSDVAARWTQVLFAVFTFLAVAAIARRLGLSRRNAALAAIAYGGIYHIFPVLSISAGNDQITSFFTLAGIDAALGLARRPRPGVAVVAGTALGLLLATKYVGVLFVPPVLGLLAAAVWIERRRREPAARPSLGRLAGLGLLLAAALAVSGGYTYLRNAISTGNPLFPAPLTVFGVEVFPGWGEIWNPDRTKEPEFQIDLWEFLTRRSRHFGPYFPFTLLPAALLAPLLALWRRQWLAALTFSLATVFFLEVLYVMSDHRDIRYFLPAVALAGVAFAWLLERTGPRALPVRGIVLAWIAFQATRHIGQSGAAHLTGALVVVVLGLLLERAWWRWRARPPVLHPWMRWAAAGVALAAAVPLGWVVATYQAEKFAELPGPLALERLAGPDGARVAYAGYNQPYFFFGSRFQNDLQIVPRNRRLDAQYYHWGMEVTDPYVEGAYRRWWNALRERGIEYVVIVRTEWEEPERRWVSRRTDDFALAWASPQVEIWKVLR
ncbi:MAG: ArnT family glycosyltransferase [Thermoanaerobaculia bacterium]